LNGLFTSWLLQFWKNFITYHFFKRKDIFCWLFSITIILMIKQPLYLEMMVEGWVWIRFSSNCHQLIPHFCILWLILVLLLSYVSGSVLLFMLIHSSSLLFLCNFTQLLTITELILCVPKRLRSNLLSSIYTIFKYTHTGRWKLQLDSERAPLKRKTRQNYECKPSTLPGAGPEEEGPGPSASLPSPQTHLIPTYFILLIWLAEL
jgi:hypothetical protein